MLANTGLGVARFIQARRQIKKAEKAREELEKNEPKLGYQPKNAQLQEALQQRGAEAQYGFGPQTLGAKASVDLAAYANAIKQAQAMGGGQTGITSTMGNNAYRTILDNNLKTAIANENEKNEKVALHSALLGQGLSEDASFRNINFQNYQNKLRRYDAKLGNLRAAEQTGQINRDKVLGQIPTMAGNIVGNLYRRKEQRGDIPIKGTKEREAYDKAQNDLKIKKSEAKEADKLQKRSDFLVEQTRRQEARRRLLNNFRNIQLNPYAAEPIPQTTPYYGGVSGSFGNP